MTESLSVSFWLLSCEVSEAEVKLIKYLEWRTGTVWTSSGVEVPYWLFDTVIRRTRWSFSILSLVSQFDQAHSGPLISSVWLHCLRCWRVETSVNHTWSNVEHGGALRRCADGKAFPVLLYLLLLSTIFLKVCVIMDALMCCSATGGVRLASCHPLGLLLRHHHR